MALGICKLCLVHKALLNSHIIPNSYFKQIKRNNNGKGITFDDSAIGMAEQSSDSWDEQLLCRDCEAQLGQWEGLCIPALRRAARQPRPGSAMIQPYDHKTFRLFFLSVLWRAAVSSQSAYAKVLLPSDVQEQFRAVLHDGTGHERAQFACQVHRVIDPDKLLTMENIVMSPTSGFVKTAMCFRFVFGGFVIDYFLPKAPFKAGQGLGFLADRLALHVSDIGFAKVPELVQSLVAGHHKQLKGQAPSTRAS
jgi:hypothetical protein